MKNATLSLAILLVAPSAAVLAKEVPARSELCKSTRTAALKVADAALLLPDLKLDKKQWDAIYNQRACLKTYGIGFPGGVDGLMNASAAQIKADLVHLTGLFNTAKTRTISSAQIEAVAAELSPQKSDDNYTLNANNRDTMRLKDIQNGISREQILLWGYHFYLRKLFAEGSYQKLIDEIAVLKGQFNMAVAPRRWDEAETHSYFSAQSLKNMIAMLEFKAGAKLIMGNTEAGKVLLTNFLETRKALMPIFKHVDGDPTSQVRAPYCGAKMQKD